MIDLTMTPAQVARAEREWTRLAGGLPIRVEGTALGEPIYGFGEELAVLRLFHKMGSGRAAYSANLQTWYYCNK